MKRKANVELPRASAVVPTAQMYEKSFMHRDVVTFVTSVAMTDFVITSSADGHVKFWRRISQKAANASPRSELEFVKHFKAHTAEIVGVAASQDGKYFASVALDKTLKVFDVLNFDLICIVELSFTPKAVCWFLDMADYAALVCCTDADSSAIHLFDALSSDGKPLQVLQNLHRAPVRLLAFQQETQVAISVDDDGMVEYWLANRRNPGSLVALHTNKLVKWSIKADTDLYDFRRRRSTPVSLTLSGNGRFFATLELGEQRQVLVFHFKTARIARKIVDLVAIPPSVKSVENIYPFLDDMDFLRRVATEHKIDRTTKFANVIFDAASEHVIFATLGGILTVKLKSCKVVQSTGVGESIRFLCLALIPAGPTQPSHAEPMLVATALESCRFYVFTNREPENAATNALGSTRDVLNEKPSKEEQLLHSLHQAH